MSAKIQRRGLLGRAIARLRRRGTASGDVNVYGTVDYWESRYGAGGNSGRGSYGELSLFKAEVLNDFVAKNEICDVIEFGCGDGNQVSLADYPYYTGYDVSAAAIDLCNKRFADDSTKAFHLVDEYDASCADLVISLDVIYHLLEDETFNEYMQRLFAASRRFVIIYSSDSDENEHYEGTWIRQWKFTAWVDGNQPGWRLVDVIQNPYPLDAEAQTGSWSDFFIYEKREGVEHP